MNHPCDLDLCGRKSALSLKLRLLLMQPVYPKDTAVS